MNTQTTSPPEPGLMSSSGLYTTKKIRRPLGSVLASRVRPGTMNCENVLVVVVSALPGLPFGLAWLPVGNAGGTNARSVRV